MITFQGPHHTVLLLVWLFLKPHIMERKIGGESETDTLCPMSLSLCINMSLVQLCSLGSKRLQGLHVHTVQVLNPSDHLTQVTVTMWLFWQSPQQTIISFASFRKLTHACTRTGMHAQLNHIHKIPNHFLWWSLLCIMALQVQSSVREANKCKKWHYTRVMETSTIIIIANHSVMPQLNTDEEGLLGNDASLDAFPEWVRCCVHSSQCQGTV